MKTDTELQKSINRIQENTIKHLSKNIGISESDCRKIVKDNTDKELRQILQIMLNTLELDDNKVERIQRFIGYIEEEE